MSARTPDRGLSHSQTCPRCGQEFTDTDPERVADLVVAHARDAHDHTLERGVVLAHLAGVRPDELED